MPIVFQDPTTQAINEALIGGTGALSQALQKRAATRLQADKENRERQALGNILQNADLSTPEGQMAVWQKGLSENVNPSVLSAVLQPYKGVLTERAKQEGAQAYLKSVLNPDMPSLQQTTPTAQGMPQGAGMPQQQEPWMQQKTQPVLQETTSAMQEPKIRNALDLGEGRVVTRDQIDQLIASPYENVRRLGEDYARMLDMQTKRDYQMDADIRKEHRGEIRKLAEPYSDFTRLRDNVKRLEEVVKLVEGEGVNLDDNAWRNVATALVEDQQGPQLAETLKTPEQQKMFSLMRPMFNTREIGGSNPSTREMLTTLSTLPSYVKSREANQYIANLMLNSAKEVLQTAKSMRGLRDKNLTVSEFQQRVDDAVEPIRQQNAKSIEVLNDMSEQAMRLKGARPSKGKVFMYLPTDGSVREIDQKDVKEATKLGAMRFNAR